VVPSAGPADNAHSTHLSRACEAQGIDHEQHPDTFASSLTVLELRPHDAEREPRAEDSGLDTN